MHSLHLLKRLWDADNRSGDRRGPHGDDRAPRVGRGSHGLVATRVRRDAAGSDVLNFNGKRQNNLDGAFPTCAATTCKPLDQVTGITANGSKDFWISVLAKPVQFAGIAGVKGIDGVVGSSAAVAQAGYWLNWTDKATAFNTTGILPANVAAAGFGH